MKEKVRGQVHWWCRWTDLDFDGQVCLVPVGIRLCLRLSCSPFRPQNASSAYVSRLGLQVPLFPRRSACSHGGISCSDWVCSIAPFFDSQSGLRSVVSAGTPMRPQRPLGVFLVSRGKSRARARLVPPVAASRAHARARLWRPLSAPFHGHAQPRLSLRAPTPRVSQLRLPQPHWRARRRRCLRPRQRWRSRPPGSRIPMAMRTSPRR
jgi:hypothetical protein